MLSRIVRLNAPRCSRGVATSAAFRVRRGTGFAGISSIPNTLPSATTAVPCSSSPTTGVTSAFTRHGTSYTMLYIPVRGVQFEQTSQTIGGINKKKKAQSTKWITKSTKDYMQEADKKIKGNASVTHVGRERIKESSLARRERVQEIAEEGEAKFQLEMDRIRDDNSSRWKKGFNFFKRQGKAFFLLYLTIYVGTFVLLYVGFASGLIKKEAAFEFLLLFFGSYMDRDNFYKRIEAWDSYINVGFAFVINEFLEVLRLPFVMMLFYQCRPLLTGVNRRVKKSIFRWNAAES